MNEELGNSSAEPQGGDTAVESIEAGDLEGLLPLVDGDGNQAEDDAQQQARAQPDGEQQQADEAESQAAAITDDSEIELGDRKVSVRELKQTFETFGQKTQELARARRDAVAEAREAVARVSEQRAHEMHLLSQQVERLVAPGYDEQGLMALAHSDPQQFFAIKARVDAARQFQDQIRQQAAQLWHQAQHQRDQAAAESEQSHQQLLSTEAQKLQAQKWWNADFQRQALAFARKHGIPDAVAGGVAYAGFVEITRKAMLYDQALSRAKTGKQPPAQAAVKPGATPARGQMAKVKAVQDTYDRARKSGDYADAGRWLDNVLPAN